MSQSEGVEVLYGVIEGALFKAGQALSGLAGSTFKPSGLTLARHEFSELPSLFGDADMPVAASFFEVQGDLSGYLLILLPLAKADLLLEELLGAGDRDEVLADSALGEVGNVVGSAFLNYLADWYHIQATPTPPQVVHDMIGALLATLATRLVMDGEPRIPLIRTELTGRLGDLSTCLLWLPGRELERLGGVT